MWWPAALCCTGYMESNSENAAAAAGNAITPGIPAEECENTEPLGRLEQRLRHGGLNARTLGVFGERYARAWLERRGWRTLERNWRSRYGELDIIMLDPERIIVFVEVKTRRSTRYGSPQEAVTAHKRLSLRRACVQWLTEPGHRMPHLGVRCDVVSITVDVEHVVVQLIPEAF